MDSIADSFFNYFSKIICVVFPLVVLTIIGAAFQSLGCHGEDRSVDLPEEDDVFKNAGHIVGGQELILPFTRGGGP